MQLEPAGPEVSGTLHPGTQIPGGGFDLKKWRSLVYSMEVNGCSRIDILYHMFESCGGSIASLVVPFPLLSMIGVVGAWYVLSTE